MVTKAKKRGGVSLTFQFVPHGDIQNLSSEDRVNRLLDIVKQNKIILMEGRIRPDEEASLIQRTMEEISDKFTGIEISPIIVEKKDVALLGKLREQIINLLLGNRQGLTIIGPANVVKEIKADPDKIQLFMEDAV